MRLHVSSAPAGLNTERPILKAASSVIAFEVSDTGVGIPAEKQKIIFEAFQQADASTSRKYGGTGLGLAISRELANLLGGEIQLRGVPGAGSAFTLYLPQKFVEAVTVSRKMQEESSGLRHYRNLLAVSDPILERPEDDRDNLESDDPILADRGG